MVVRGLLTILHHARRLPIDSLGTTVDVMSVAKKRSSESSSHSTRSTKRFGMRRKSAELITDAKKSPLEDWHHRRRLYLVLQVMRIPVLVAAVLALWLTQNLALGAVLAFISVPLPWAAVILANEAGEATKKSDKIYKPGVVRENRAARTGTELSGGPLREVTSRRSDSSGVIDHIPDSASFDRPHQES